MSTIYNNKPTERVRYSKMNYAAIGHKDPKEVEDEKKKKEILIKRKESINQQA